jgi:hypothetical protein
MDHALLGTLPGDPERIVDSENAGTGRVSYRELPLEATY